MPNHVHGVLVIDKKIKYIPLVETRQCLVSTNCDTKVNRFQNQGKQTISSIIGSFKSICTKKINKIQNQTFFGWQPRFYDHIIRNEKSLNAIRQYIRDNPINWCEDKLYRL
jgi:REP element-mobilizing transposase RayT